MFIRYGREIIDLAISSFNLSLPGEDLILAELENLDLYLWIGMGLHVFFTLLAFVHGCTKQICERLCIHCFSVIDREVCTVFFVFFILI